MKTTSKRVLDYRKAKMIAREIMSSVLRFYSDYQAERDAERISRRYGISYRKTLVFIRALNRLKCKFPDKGESWLVRAAIRVAAGVDRVGRNKWRVPGLRELGDAYAWYLVKYSGRFRTYICDCYFHYGGVYRERSVCTHIAAVIVYREMNSLLHEFMETEVYG